MYQYEENPDFHALSRKMKCKQKKKGWTQEYLARLVDRPPLHAEGLTESVRRKQKRNNSQAG